MKAAPEYDLDRIGDGIRGGEGSWAWKMTHDIRSFMCSCTGRVSLSLVRSPGSLLVSRLPLLLKVPPTVPPHQVYQQWQIRTAFLWCRTRRRSGK